MTDASANFLAAICAPRDARQRDGGRTPLDTHNIELELVGERDGERSDVKASVPNSVASNITRGRAIFPK